MAISLAHHSGPSPADPQNIATCSSVDSYPSSSLKIPTSLYPKPGSGARVLLDQVYLPLISRLEIALFPQLRRAGTQDFAVLTQPFLTRNPSSPNVPFTVQLYCFRKDPHDELQEGDSLDTTLEPAKRHPRGTNPEWTLDAITNTLTRSRSQIHPTHVGDTGSRRIRMRYLSSCRSRFLLEISIANPLYSVGWKSVARKQ
ncbi:uncharacterized protein F5891DRAFT_1193079 [Suillus fuscotomentosus]|uniref:Uncharacterized protein n=1 Tax=Suillus fuscotomentosus TaxID=1912939 RepID=A0AAD4DZF9_9AGAM|nr:uncharacterized protein F5891DRAFT_1193079 [Suillus fuscotomentosus]KAG1896492.1 hypothetical protein F5891DRAFT_1193079 [Suillus fuscotomentosus]